MTTERNLREHCDKLRVRRQEDLKTVLNDYFESAFISAHRPWKAVIGNKRCKPIPIHRDFCFLEETLLFSHKFQWPNFSEEVLRKELSNLGFVVTEHRISISVPACAKDEKLTFAQRWVKKINASYSEYCAIEMKKAKALYPEIISKLFSTSTKNIKTCDGYTLFCGFEIDCKMSPKCAAYIRKLMLHDGIEECYENGEYKGIKVLQQPSN